jgi:hypothetical protein
MLIRLIYKSVYFNFEYQIVNNANVTKFKLFWYHEKIKTIVVCGIIIFISLFYGLNPIALSQHLQTH